MNSPRPLAFATTLAALAACTAASAQTVPSYFLRQNQASGWNWHTTQTGNLNSWHITASGSAVQITAMDATGHYFTQGFQVRTPENSSANTFGGAKLIIQTGGSLSMKTTNGTTARAIVPWLETQGSTSVLAANANHFHNLSIGTFDQAGTTTFSASAGRSFDLTITEKLNGSGTIVFSGGATTSNFRLTNIANAADFTGTFSLTGGTLLFAADLSASKASLTIGSGTLVNLSHSVSVSALNIAGTTLANGTYSYTWLNENFGTIFTAGSVDNGSITVGVIPEPSAFAALAGLGALAFATLRRRRA